MSWLKLTEKSLYLMEGGKYLKKVDLRDHNGEQALDIPFDWFKGQGDNVPMVVSITHNATATEPAPKSKAVSPRFSGKDLASRILSYMDSKGYTIFEGLRKYNIVYIEGMNPNGSLNSDSDNVFNDIRLVIEMIDGHPKIVGGPWLASTEPGSYYVKYPMNSKGAARIQFSQYTAWQVGIHGNSEPHEALVQTGGVVTVHRDFDKNGIRTGDKLDTGYFGINQHSGYDNPVSHVGKASAGCLIARSRADHRQFMALIKQDLRYQKDKKFIFTSTIIPGDDLVKQIPA
ncbi:hypothetical protein S7335_3153 [Synechococcus sp. PCC 7335]|uniref:hypothetical protein n=1 Tax=Synechococcus sp. (strain ATCC 29403 / PCC 7335) TaxID=91464 RepID=UPI00017EE426|nr:hypothetical protein [Synechococcus sp. PCC 7335]EDX85452.1 hypothetical protein S7335_3153 [Synechococcus sp. PCC 7335]